MIQKLVEQFEQTLTEIMGRIVDGAAVTLQRRLGQSLKSEIKLVYNKREAADFLCFKSVMTLENLVREGRIGHYKNAAGDNGRVSFGLHHLLCYLRRIERAANARDRIKFDDFYTYPSDGFVVTERGLQLVGGTDAKNKKGAA